MNRRGNKRNKLYPYKSNLEKRLHNGPLKNKEYEPKWAKVDYIIEGKSYLPDFVDKDNKNVVYEAKGYFRTHEEAVKYLHVKRSNPDLCIRFIISSPNKRAYPQTKMVMGNWLTKYGFEWCTEEDIPEEWKR